MKRGDCSTGLLSTSRASAMRSISAVQHPKSEIPKSSGSICIDRAKKTPAAARRRGKASDGRIRRLGGAGRCLLVEPPHRDAERLRLVREVGRDAGAREHDDADRQRLEEAVVALEGSGAAFAGPVGLKDDLRDLAIVGPAGGDALGA